MSRSSETSHYYDPVERHLAIEKLVTRRNPVGQQEKKYYRVRPARWYGGIVTADCTGCGLLCKFCWVADEVMFHPATMGKFYTPERMAVSLVALAKKKELTQLRVSGGEPTIGKPHLLELLHNLQNHRYKFILETNGILLGADGDYAKDLAKYSDFIHVRVSLKGCNEQEFAVLTGSKKEGFQLQLKALQNLMRAGVGCHPSVMSSFSPKGRLSGLTKRLREMDPRLTQEIEIEELILYPHVVKRLKKYGLAYYIAHTPDRIPPDQI
nr:radical SAM protein [Candidatus Njordarchaeota archaeon]